MTLSGSLRDFNLFSVFGMINSEKKIGTLNVRSEDASVIFYFNHGNVIGVSKDQYVPEDTLTSMLLRSKKVSFEEIQNIVDEHTQSLKPIEEITVESSIITLKDLQDVLHMQAMNTIYHVFSWNSADFRFEPLISDKYDFNSFPPIPIDTLLLNVAKFLDEWPKIQKKLPDYNQVLSISDGGKALLESSHGSIGELGNDAMPMIPSYSALSVEEEIIIQYFLQPKSITDILKISKFNELDSCRYILSLLDKELLENYYKKTMAVSPIIRQMASIHKKQATSHQKPSPIFWPSFAALLLAAVFYHETSINELLGIELHPPILPRLEPVANQQTHERASFVDILNKLQLDANHLAIPDEPNINSSIDPGIYKFSYSEAKKVFSSDISQ
jgi:hypothetical protein